MQLASRATGLLADAPVQGEAAREVKRESRPFTGTVSGDSVRLLFSDGGALADASTGSSTAMR